MALLFAIPGFLPLLVWMNWFIIPIALVGLGFSLVSRKTSGRNFNHVVLALCVLRLMLGGGIF